MILNTLIDLRNVLTNMMTKYHLSPRMLLGKVFESTT